MTVKRICAAAVALMVTVPASNATAAKDYPSKSVTIYVGHGAGGNVDTMSRIIAEVLTRDLGTNFVVVNKAGAGGALTATAVAKAKPDGYTLGISISETFSYVPQARKVGYSLESFRYLGLLGRFQTAYVSRSDAPWKTFKGMVEYAKKNKKSLAYASILPLDKLIADYMTRKWGVRMIPIPVKSGAGMVQKLLGGHVDYGFSGGIHASYVDAGKMIVLAATHADGLKDYPNAPSLKDIGVPVSFASQGMIVAPKGLPDPVAKKLEAAIAKVAKDPKFLEFIKRAKLEPRYLPSDKAKKEVEDQASDIKKIITELKQK